MGRAQYAKGSKKGHLRIGRNSACRANAADIHLSVRAATHKYTKNLAATPRLRTIKSARLTPRTSARLQPKILGILVGGKHPRGGFVATLAKEFDADRNFPAIILLKSRTRVTGNFDARVSSKTSGQPVVFGDAYKKLIVKQAEKARNHKPRPFVANASIIQAAMIKSTDPAITEIPTAPHTDRPHEAKRQGIKTPVLVYNRATVHTSKETQEELDRAFEKGNHEAQSPKSPDTNNGDAGLFPNGARATACSCATKKAEVETYMAAWWKTVD